MSITYNQSEEMQLLNSFSEMANQTNGGSFTLTRLKKDGFWKLTFLNHFNDSNVRLTAFTNFDLKVVLKSSIKYLKRTRRRTINSTVKYTLR